MGKTLKGSLLSVLILVSLVSTSLTFVSAADSSTKYFIDITSVNGYPSSSLPSLKNPVQILGTVSATKFAGQLSAYNVQINWGDGTTELAASLNIIPNGADFTGSWTAKTHYYSAAGTYVVTVKLYHMQVPGAESADSQTIVVLTLDQGVVISTSPQGLRINVDSREYVAPVLFNTGGPYTISTSSPQAASAGTQYAWTRWDDGGAITHTTAQNNGVITAIFETQHQLTVQVSPAGITTISGSGWYTQGSIAVLTAPPVNGYTFDHWEINGNSQGTNPQISTTISGPTTAMAIYRQNSGPTPTPSPTPTAPPSPSPTPPTSPNPTPPTTSPTPQPTANPTPPPTTNPSPNPTNSPTSTPPPTTGPSPPINPPPVTNPSPSPSSTPAASPSPSVTPTPAPSQSPPIAPTPAPTTTPNPSASPKPSASPLPTPSPTPVQTSSPTPTPTPTATPTQQSVSVTFGKTNVRGDFVGTVLTVDGKAYNNAQLPVTFTWQFGSQHTFEYASPLTVDATRNVFDYASGLATKQAGTLAAAISGTVNAVYKTEYYLDVVSDFGEPQGSGWYGANSVAQFSVNTPVDQGNKTLRVLANWSGDATLSEQEGSIVMIRPSVVTASWETQYFVTFNTTLPNLSVLTVPGVPASLAGTSGLFGAYYRDGGTVSVGPAPDVVTWSDGTKYLFKGWTLNGLPVFDEPQISFLVCKPVNIAVDYGTSHLLTIEAVGVSDPFVASVTITASPPVVFDLSPDSPVTDWLHQGVNAQLAISKSSKIGHGDWAVFQEWADENQQYAGALAFQVNSPILLQASFIKLNPVAQSLLFSAAAGLTSMAALTLAARKKSHKWRTGIAVFSGVFIMAIAVAVGAFVSSVIAVNNSISPGELLDFSNWAVVFSAAQALALMVASTIAVWRVQRGKVSKQQAQFDSELQSFAQ